MGRLTLEGNPPVEVILRRSARARRLSLRVSRLDGRATLTMPHGVPEREAEAFLTSREDWLRRHLASVTPETFLGLGAAVPFRGADLKILQGTGRRIVLEGTDLRVPGDAARFGPRIAAWMKAQARDALAEASDRYAAALGKSYGRLTLRDTRSRWGSCSSAGDLMYSWRLVMAPVEVLEYVAAHEVAHLRHMDHSAAFWATVGEIFPGYERQRRWLREEGHHLHRVRFD